MMMKAKLLAVAALGVLVLSACGEELVIPTAAVGDCLQSGDLESTVNQFATVDCSTPHDAEVIGVVELQYSGDYDANAVIEESNTACLEFFEPYVGTDYNESALLLRPVHPTAVTWEAGDTQTICVATAPEMVSESFAGSGL